MRLDCTQYAKTLESYAYFASRYPNPLDSTCIFSASTGVPVLVVCLHALKNFYPNDPQLLKQRVRLIEFNGYTEIVE